MQRMGHTRVVYWTHTHAHTHTQTQTHTHAQATGTRVYARTSDTTARVHPSTLFARVVSTSDGKRIMVGVSAFTNTCRVDNVEAVKGEGIDRRRGVSGRDCLHKKKRGGAEESRAEQRRQDQTSSAECLPGCSCAPHAFHASRLCHIHR